MIDFGQLGDVVLSLPALKALRDRFPSAHISVLTGKVPDQVVRHAGVADEVLAVDRVELRDGPKMRSIAKIIGLARDIRRRPIDLVIDLHSLPETNILAFLSKTKYRLLANRENRSLDRLSNFRPAPPIEDKTRHLSDRYLDVLRPLGITNAERDFRFDIADADAKFVNERFQFDKNKTAGLFPGAGHLSRCWSLGNFALLAEKLVDDGFVPTVFLGPEETEMREKIAGLFPPSTGIVDRLSIQQFIAAASRLAMFVTNDTGPMHLAACAGAPVVLLLDGRAPTTYLPITEKLVVVRAETIDDIPVEDVHAAALSLAGHFGSVAK